MIWGIYLNKMKVFQAKSISFTATIIICFMGTMNVYFSYTRNPNYPFAKNSSQKPFANSHFGDNSLQKKEPIETMNTIQDFLSVDTINVYLNYTRNPDYSHTMEHLQDYPDDTTTSTLLDIRDLFRDTTAVNFPLDVSSDTTTTTTSDTPSDTTTTTTSDLSSNTTTITTSDTPSDTTTITSSDTPSDTTRTISLHVVPADSSTTTSSADSTHL